MPYWASEAFGESGGGEWGGGMRGEREERKGKARGSWFKKWEREVGVE